MQEFVVVRGAHTNSDFDSAGVQFKVLCAKLVTFITALEPALLAPLFLMMLGLDTYASLTSVWMAPVHFGVIFCAQLLQTGYNAGALDCVTNTEALFISG